VDVILIPVALTRAECLAVAALIHAALKLQPEFAAVVELREAAAKLDSSCPVIDTLL
jgi:hypothetical protein